MSFDMNDPRVFQVAPYYGGDSYSVRGRVHAIADWIRNDPEGDPLDLMMMILEGLRPIVVEPKERKPNERIDDETRDAIKRLYQAGGLSQAALADQFDVSRASVRVILQDVPKAKGRPGRKAKADVKPVALSPEELKEAKEFFN